jgi:hypothetical protein
MRETTGTAAWGQAHINAHSTKNPEAQDFYRREIPEQAIADSQDAILAEARRILRGETMMLATRKHLEAVGRLNEELLAALRAIWAGVGDDVRAIVDKPQLADHCTVVPALYGALAKIKAVIAKAEV